MGAACCVTRRVPWSKSPKIGGCQDHYPRKLRAFELCPHRHCNPGKDSSSGDGNVSPPSPPAPSPSTKPSDRPADESAAGGSGASSCSFKRYNGKKHAQISKSSGFHKGAALKACAGGKCSFTCVSAADSTLIEDFDGMKDFATYDADGNDQIDQVEFERVFADLKQQLDAQDSEN